MSSNPIGQPKLLKWPHKFPPTEELVAAEMATHGFKTYDLQTIPGWFERSSHSHDIPEIRGAVAGVTTFYFPDLPPISIEPGDILFIPAGVPHEVKTHNPHPFTGYKGSLTGERRVTEFGDGKGAIEY